MEFDFSTVNAMGRTYANGQRIVLEETRNGITRSVIQIEADAKRGIATDTHTSQRSLTHEVVTHGNNVTGRAGTNYLPAKIIETGRSAGGPMPPQGVLLGWMRRHGIDERFEFVLRRSIARRGIRPRPYLKPALDKNRPAITREMAAVLKRTMTRLAAGRG
jgi:hypothetical protein